MCLQRHCCRADDGVVATTDVGPVVWLGYRFLAGSKDHVRLLHQDGTMFVAVCVPHDASEAFELAHEDSRHPFPGLADFVEGALDEAFVPHLGGEHPDLTEPI